ncbi:MAG: hypothetical protein JOZ80_09305 [Acidobacteriaceae bacterium]|nr:hypothetical protein [Acidobacteriaceae bacterium]
MFTNEQGPEVGINRSTAIAMSHELHKTAQPLTVLHGVLELALEKAHTVEDYRQCCQHAIAELQRVAESFDEVRKLLRSGATGMQGTERPHTA